MKYGRSTPLIGGSKPIKP